MASHPRLASADAPPGDRRGPLVDFLVIGAMKCGTTSLHHYLSAHPQIGLAPDKELNFFYGSRPGTGGNLWRGVDWYRRQMPGGTDIVGDVSPGYTSPDHPDVAERVARLVPQARLVYLVRDPLDRAVSQYGHHRRDGTEQRPIEEALVDPRSHYVRRSRYAARLRPFVERFPGSSIAVVDHEDLLHRTQATVEGLCRFLGVDPDRQPDVLHRRLNRSARRAPRIGDDIEAEFRAMVADDAAVFERRRARLHDITPEEAPAARMTPSG